MSDLLLVLVWIGGMMGILFIMYCLSVVGEVWQRMEEYDRMRSRGFTLMENDSGDDFWVGYGD